LHSLERLITVLEHVPLTVYSGFSYRVIANRWRDSPLSAIGAFELGGRYNAPQTFPVLGLVFIVAENLLEISFGTPP
jgi:RES domain-containing protein